MRRLSGRNRSALIIGLQGIRARKLRTLLSMVSLFLGILAVVAVQAGASIAERALLADVELTSGYDGTRIADIQGTKDTIDIVVNTVTGRPDAVGMIQMQATVGEHGVSPIQLGEHGFNDAITSGPFEYCYPGPAEGVTCPPIGQAISLSLSALTGDVRAFRPFRQVSGEWLSFGTIPSMSPRLVLNREAAVGFGMFSIPAEMRLDGGSGNGVTPQFIGVVDDGLPYPNAYVRVDELSAWTPPESSNVQVLLSGSAAPVEQVLASKLKGAGVSFGTYTVQSREDFKKEISLMRLLFLGLSAFVLLIGVAGVLNVGLATVGERVEEFALRRAVGTPRSLLAGIVLAETLLTGLLTAAAAIGFAAGALRIAVTFFGESDPFLSGLQFPWQAAVAGILAGLIAGILGGFIPALRAARIPIATVMRA